MKECIERSLIIAVLMVVKNKYLDKPYVTVSECSKLEKILEKEFNKQKINFYITPTINKEHFLEYNGVFHRKIYLNNLESLYKAYTNQNVYDIVWNEELILQKVFNQTVDTKGISR